MDKDLLSIGDLSDQTGLSADLLRVWERRYGFPLPVRLPSGHRRYRQSDVSRLRLMASALAQGHRASKVAVLAEGELQALVHPARENRPRDQAIWDAVQAMDSEGLRVLLLEAWEQEGLKGFLAETVGPLLAQVGQSWAEGLLGIEHEHLVTEVLEDVLRSLRRQYPPRAQGPCVALATLPGENHRLGLLMAGLAYAATGCRVEMLGTDLPLRALANGAQTLGAQVVAVSVSIQGANEWTRRLLADLRSMLPEAIRLVVGGAGSKRLRKQPGVARVSFDQL